MEVAIAWNRVSLELATHLLIIPIPSRGSPKVVRLHATKDSSMQPPGQSFWERWSAYLISVLRFFSGSLWDEAIGFMYDLPSPSLAASMRQMPAAAEVKVAIGPKFVSPGLLWVEFHEERFALCRLQPEVAPYVGIASSDDRLEEEESEEAERIGLERIGSPCGFPMWWYRAQSGDISDTDDSQRTGAEGISSSNDSVAGSNSLYREPIHWMHSLLSKLF